jgi:hypothetical protein
MGKAERDKGNRAERAVVATLRRWGWEAMTSRSARGGTQKGADVITDFPAVIEVKDWTRLDLAGWLKQLAEEQGDDPGFVIHKKRGKSNPEEWYVTGTLRDLLRLVKNIE